MALLLLLIKWLTSKVGLLRRARHSHNARFRDADVTPAGAKQQTSHRFT